MIIMVVVPISECVHLFVQPVRVLNPGDWVGDALHGSWDGNDLLYGTPQTFLIVGPIHQLPHVGSFFCIPPCAIGQQYNAD